MKRSKLVVPILSFVLAAATGARPAAAQVAAPGDVYYVVNDYRDFRYYVFAADHVVWSDSTASGTELHASGSRDTLMTRGTAHLSTSYDALDGAFSADLAATSDIDLRTGGNDLLTNRLTVSVYVKGPTGTPYWIAVRRAGHAIGERLGGLPGSLAPVNGVSTSTLGDTTAYTEQTASITKPVDDAYLLSGVTGSTITVGSDTYSLARTVQLLATAWNRQSVCVLGCMTAPASFFAEASGRFEFEVFPYLNPVAVPGAASSPDGLSLRATPNPARDRVTVAFRAAAGEPVRVEVFDLRGRRAATLFDGLAPARETSVDWDARELPRGVYFVRVLSAGRSVTTRIARLD